MVQECLLVPLRLLFSLKPVKPNPEIQNPRSGAFLTASDPGVIFTGCFSVDVFFLFFLFSTVCHSIAVACSPLVTGVFESQGSTLLLVSSETTYFFLLLSMFLRRSSISFDNEMRSWSILRSIAARRADSPLFSAVEHEGSLNELLSERLVLRL